MSDDSLLNELFQAASAVMGNSYSPYSNHPVAAAVRTADGDVFAGVNVEIANYKGLCAEATAIGAMTTQKGGRPGFISEVAVVGPGDQLCTPCGDCRQRIREFADKDTIIHVFNRAGELMKSYTMEELLPDSFGPENVDGVQNPAL